MRAQESTLRRTSKPRTSVAQLPIGLFQLMVFSTRRCENCSCSALTETLTNSDLQRLPSPRRVVLFIVDRRTEIQGKSSKAVTLYGWDTEETSDGQFYVNTADVLQAVQSKLAEPSKLAENGETHSYFSFEPFMLTCVYLAYVLVGVPSLTDSDSAEYFAEGFAGTLSTNGTILQTTCTVSSNSVLTVFFDSVSVSYSFSIGKLYLLLTTYEIVLFSSSCQPATSKSVRNTSLP